MSGKKEKIMAARRNWAWSVHTKTWGNWVCGST